MAKRMKELFRHGAWYVGKREDGRWGYWDGPVSLCADGTDPRAIYCEVLVDDLRDPHILYANLAKGVVIRYLLTDGTVQDLMLEEVASLEFRCHESCPEPLKWGQELVELPEDVQLELNDAYDKQVVMSDTEHGYSDEWSEEEKEGEFR